MDRTEMLSPAGDSRLVVDNDLVGALVAKGYHVIEPTDLPITHEAAAFGLGKPEEPVIEEPDAPESPKSSDKGVSAADAIAAIDEMIDADAIKAYVDGEKRVTVNDAAAERLADIADGEAAD